MNGSQQEELLVLVAGCGLLVAVYFVAIFHERKLALMLIPAGLTLALLSAAYYLAGSLSGDLAAAVVYGFWGIQLALAVGLVYRCRRVWLSVTLLAALNLVGAFWFGFISIMALSGSWL